MAVVVFLGPGGVLLSPRDGLLDTVVIARPAHLAAAGAGVVVVVFFLVEETVVGGGLPVVHSLLGSGVGDSGGQEVARLPADVRVFLVAALDVEPATSSSLSHSFLNSPSCWVIVL